MRAYGGRNRIRQVGRQVVERGADRLPKPARSQPPSRFVDGNDAPDLQRLGGFLLGAIFARVGGVAQNLKLRLDDLQLAAALVFFYLAVQGDHLPGSELVLQVGRVKQEAAQAGASLPHGQLENRHAARAEEPGIAHFTDHGGHLAGAQFGNPARIQPVFIAKGKVMEQVADGVDSLGGQNFGNARTNALHILNGGGEFEHAQSWRKSSVRNHRKEWGTESIAGAGQKPLEPTMTLQPSVPFANLCYDSAFISTAGGLCGV